MKKIAIKYMGNHDNYNELDIEKSEIFLRNLQDFIIDIGLANDAERGYEFNGKFYDMKTFYTLFYEDDNLEMNELTINNLRNGEIARYFNKEIELLIIFLKDKIKLIFYCDLKIRKKILDSLLKFCEIKETNL